ncbi:MAG: SHOCT domain-containing protein [Lachnospiraceae bacterium]|nr:SHOCT domain-containing protein [Lachnospiraceae bacterium]
MKDGSSAISSESAPAADYVSEIKKYKEILDAGVLTEEEFTAKKRQLLGI